MTSFDNEVVNFGMMKNSRHSTYYIFKGGLPKYFETLNNKKANQTNILAILL